MTNTERFRCILNGKFPDDRLPVIEWASWWNLTLERWEKEGLTVPRGDELFRHFGLDVFHQHWLQNKTADCPTPATNGAPIMDDEEDYERIKPMLYPEHAIDPVIKSLKEAKPKHDSGDIVIWYTLEGAFWFPRTLFGIENHFYSFYDYPELYHRILDDLSDFYLRQLEKIYTVCTPEFMTFAEDMSYNLGPMLSEKMFDEFLLPFYQRLIPYIHSHGTKVIIDSDGDISLMVPWLIRAGIDGVLPLERKAGVDLNALSEQYPDFLFIGGFDKMVMKDGEAAMRKEFERLLPVMKKGHYIPSVDHQTPPDVSLETYHVYLKLLNEYAEKAVK